MPVPRATGSAVALFLLASASAGVRGQATCGEALPGRGFTTNMPGKPMQYAQTAGDCCAFCHATTGCRFWTWNGPPPWNGLCYAKATNTTMAGHDGMVSGGIAPGPPLPPPRAAAITLVSTQPVAETEATYASWNIDSSCNRGFHRIHFDNANLRAAALGLAPSRLRFGGSGNDNLVYGLTPGSPECRGIAPSSDCGYTTPGCLNASHWESLYGFAQAGGAEFIFGVAYGLVAACDAGSEYVWNSSNAATLLQHLADRNQSVFGFELGNEVNNNGGAPCNQTARQQAHALLAFSRMVAAKAPGAVLIGPDTGYRDAEAWLEAYLPLVGGSGGGGILHAVTHHVYPGTNRRDFNSPQSLDGSLGEIAWYTSVVSRNAPNAQVWAGEDGPIGGGNDGTCGGNGSVCGTFASALWYADDMALRARHGFAQYQRQAFFGGAYGLTNTAVQHPQSALGPDEPLLLRPGYWANFLWKRTLGAQVLNVTSDDPFVRAYAFSGNPPSQFAAAECSAKGALQLLLINLLESSSKRVASLPAVGGSNTWAGWIMTPPSSRALAQDGVNEPEGGDQDPFSFRVELNGVSLPATVDLTHGPSAGPAFLQHIPVPAREGNVTQGIVLPPLGVAFVCY